MRWGERERERERERATTYPNVRKILCPNKLTVSCRRTTHGPTGDDDMSCESPMAMGLPLVKHCCCSPLPSPLTPL